MENRQKQDLVSVIIPTYNRLPYLLNAIKSVHKQTYQNIEIIVVNDRSTDQEYYTFDFQKEFTKKNTTKETMKSIKIIHLEKNSRQLFGFPSPGGHARNEGMKVAKGIYFAFLDDDDYYFPRKIEKQINAMKKHGSKVCCTDAMLGQGAYSPDLVCEQSNYNGINWISLCKIYAKRGKLKLLHQMFQYPVNFWTKEMLNIHNCTSGSSTMVIHNSIYKMAGGFPILRYADDYAYWKKIMKFSNIMFLRQYLTYFDKKHGDGINYGSTKKIKQLDDPHRRKSIEYYTELYKRKKISKTLYQNKMNYYISN